MPHSTAVINVAGLNQSLIGDWSPNLALFAHHGCLRHLQPDLPAVTCTVQASMLTGKPPREHGIVGNGWYDRELCEIYFWKQSNHLVHGEKVWETARKIDPTVTCLNMFWWFNMYSSVNFSVTPRPIYKADGRKIPDCYSHPPELRDTLQRKLGPFPLFKFWGPGASIQSSRWIADATMLAHDQFDPTLALVYLPHLDYSLQKLGPEHTQIHLDVQAVDAIVGELLDYFAGKGVRVMVVSEYGIEPVEEAVHINRELRKASLLRVREEQGREVLDPGASEAFAVADHQAANIYVRDVNFVDQLAADLRQLPGVDHVYTKSDQQALEIDHARSGDLLLITKPQHWFSYCYWLDDDRAPDFARTVDIHRKPGYDPLELFLDPNLFSPHLHIAWRLFQTKVLRQRALWDVIPLDTSLVRGSHGRVDQPQDRQSILITQRDDPNRDDHVSSCRAIREIILEHLFDGGPE